VSTSQTGRRRRAAVGTLAAASVGALLISVLPGTAIAASSAHSGTAVSGYTAGRYIVQLLDSPVAAYDGHIAGLRASKPAAGTKFAARSTQALAYRSYLQQRQNSVLAIAGVHAKYSYTTVFNGFAADLTAAQASKLAHLPGVVKVSKDTMRHVDTVNSPEFLGLTGPNGVWSKLGGTDQATGAGSGVIVGVIDTGIWPENASFTGPKVKVDSSGNVLGVSGWAGACVTGTDWTTADCNRKIVGARYYVDGFGADNISPNEYLSPRDGSGHGSHTSSTSAGNANVPVTIDGTFIGKASGMAPAAKIAMYKVCWEGAQGVAAGCTGSDSVKAIDDAVADGVDVINFSISGTEDNFLDPVEVSFLFAARAGVFVSASSGNSGPTPSTTNHPSPWLTTVAASTDAINESTVATGDGQKFIGASVTAGLSTPTALVLAQDAGLAGADPAAVALCTPDTLDPLKATGKIVVCDRGVVARLDKSFEVQRAGGVGMILANTSPNSLNADFHPIPTVHVDEVAGAAIKAYMASTPTPTATILAGVHVGSTTQIPEVAEFSSRGPTFGAGGDLLKPDISAPGVDIVAAVAPPSNHGRSWDYYSGTSMAAPHIAGIAALLKEAHPTWSPMMIKSAMMTTARDNKSTTDPFAQGAGFIRPANALDPGLVFDSGWADWLGFLQGQGLIDAGLAPIAATDLNEPSVAIGSLAGKQTTTRTVTNVGAKETYKPSVTGVNGVVVKVTPSSFTLKTGQTQVVTISFTRKTAALDTYSTGFIRFGGSKHTVRIPVAVKPVAIAVPAEVTGTGAAGNAALDLKPGYSGTLTTSVAGLASATPQAGLVEAGAFSSTSPVESPSAVKFSVTVPAGTTLARFAEVAADQTNDLDLYVYRGGVLVGLSATGAASEAATLANPPAGTYDVYVNGFTVNDASGKAAFDFAGISVGSTDLGNATVTPASSTVTTGVPTSLSLAWSGLDPSKWYLGWVGYSDGTNDIGQTVVSIS